MWRNFRFWCMTFAWNFSTYGVDNVPTHVKFMLFWCLIGFVAFYTVMRAIGFVLIYALLCGEKFKQKITNVEKNDKYQLLVVWGPSGPRLQAMGPWACLITSFTSKVIFFNILTIYWGFHDVQASKLGEKFQKVCFYQVCPQMACMKEYKTTLIAFVRFLNIVPYKMHP